MLQHYSWSEELGKDVEGGADRRDAEVPVIGSLFAFYSISSIFTPSME